MKSIVLILALLIGSGQALSPSAPGGDGPDLAAASAGRRLAMRQCGGCHGVPDAPSSLPDAPPFATLKERYRPGCLGSVLSEGMLAPLRPPEEGSPRSHPRMPMAVLDDDQIRDLTAYLQSLDRRAAPRTPDCAPERGAAPAGEIPVAPLTLYAASHVATHGATSAPSQRAIR